MERVFVSYLVAYLFIAGIVLGSMAVTMIHNLTGGRWGVPMRRTLDASMRTLPLLALLFLPVLAGMGSLYEWARPGADAGAKAAYLNVPFFVVRAVFYFVTWTALSRLLMAWAGRPDETASGRLQLASGLGLAGFALTVTFASVDWVMSLDLRWFSTIHGLLFMAGGVLSALALCVIVSYAEHERKGEASRSSEFSHDAGNLLLAFVMLWAYMSFSQYLIIWSANLPEEIPWYLDRTSGLWMWVGWGLIAFHFALPFVLLLCRPVKRYPKILAAVAVWLLLMRFVDIVWNVVPAVKSAKGPHLLDLVLTAVLGTVWLAVFRTMRKGGRVGTRRV